MKINLDLFIELSRREFLERYVGSILGLWWFFIWSVINILIYTLIFSNVMIARIPELSSSYSYGLYLASGIIPWMAFSNTVTRSTNVFIEKKHLITKVPIYLPILPITVAISESIIFFISFLVLIAFLIFFDLQPTLFSFFIPFAYIFQQILAISLGLIFAIFNVFVRDIKEIVTMFLQVWFWFTPIVYTIDILPSDIKNLIEINPLYAFIQIYQNSLVLRKEVNFKALLIFSLVAIIFFILAQILYKRLEKDIRDSL